MSKYKTRRRHAPVRDGTRDQRQIQGSGIFADYHGNYSEWAPGGSLYSPPKPGQPGFQAPSLGWVTFVAYSDEPAANGQTFTCLLGDSTPNIAGGMGGWQIVQRKRRRALTEWQGNDPLQLTIPLLFDDFAAHTSIEKDVSALERMAGYHPHITEPPMIAFDSGGVIQHDASRDPNKDWILYDIQWGDANRNSLGHRIRQAATVTVAEHIADDHLSRATSAQRRRARNKRQKARHGAQKKAKHNKYVVKGANETLETIAAHQLHNVHRWREIRKLNPKYRDPKKILLQGVTLLMP